MAGENHSDTAALVTALFTGAAGLLGGLTGFIHSRKTREDGVELGERVATMEARQLNLETQHSERRAEGTRMQDEIRAMIGEERRQRERREEEHSRTQDVLFAKLDEVIQGQADMQVAISSLGHPMQRAKVKRKPAPRKGRQ